MADPFLGEIRMFAFAFAPQDWALCNGAVLPIRQNQALYAILGMQYQGGSAGTSFALPDLRGRTPVCAGQYPGRTAYVVGNSAGAESVALSASNIPAHTHTIFATANVPTGLDVPPPLGNYPGTVHLSDSTIPPSGHQIYGALTHGVPLNAGTIGISGASAAHANMQPFSVVNYCIALAGMFPSHQ